MRDMRWTDEQVEAITAAGDVLLEASAGTGKTTTIVGKILWLLGLPVGVRGETGEPLPPCSAPCRLEQIAAITFTEKAAYDLKKKLRTEIERSGRGTELRWLLDRASVGTIHAFCASLLRDHALRLGIDPTFRILDERETQLALDDLIREVVLESLEGREPGTISLVKRFGVHRLGRRAGTIGHVRAVLRDLRWRSERYAGWLQPRREGEIPRIDAAGLRSLAAVALGEQPGERDDRVLADASALHALGFAALRRWLEWLESENVRDYDSLILDARRLLSRPATRPALENLRRRLRILIIDEFQDTDGAQRDIAFAIAGLAEPAAERGPQLVLVGDPKQSIYRFRGADIAVWNDVRGKIGRKGRVLVLSHNFRSEPAVVEFVNVACRAAMTECATLLAEQAPESRVGYRDLVPWRHPSGAVGVEWLAAPPAADGKEAERRMVASRIRRLVAGETVIDPESEIPRRCTFRDIVVLARVNKTLTQLEPVLREYEVPFYNTATAGLAARQEILDTVTLLRAMRDPADDRSVFAFLRSPFVGLRDEILARIRLDPTSGPPPLQEQAWRFLQAAHEGRSEWFEAPEGPRIGATEREALTTGLQALRDAQVLSERADAAELLEDVIERTGYRLHLLLRPGAAEALANLERFLSLVEEYRHLSPGEFLRVWDQWSDEDLGLPQAPLFSREDDVVTLSTIHTAKGLEWPVVVLAGAGSELVRKGRLTNKFWSDSRYGPVFMPGEADRGPRTTKLFERERTEQLAEEARLLYVAATRARDRLVVAAPLDPMAGNRYARWLSNGMTDARELHEVEPPPAAAGGELPERSDGGRRLEASAHDEATGTGRQIDAFGFDDDPEDRHGQLSLFAPTNHEAQDASSQANRMPERAALRSRPVVIRETLPIQGRLAQLPISLSWLEHLERAELPESVRPIPVPRLSRMSSATELMLRERDPEAWALRYRHGVLRPWEFAPAAEGDAGLSPVDRGVLIHGVLERIQAADELSRVLDETIAGLDAPGLEVLLLPGSVYREALEREIEHVVTGPEWAWYVDGVESRELEFVHLAGPVAWRRGALDLYRPVRPGARDVRDGAAWVIDFKTHGIAAEEAEGTAREYGIQAKTYREAAEALAEGEEVRVLLHFTHPNVVVELGPEGRWRPFSS